MPYTPYRGTGPKVVPRQWTTELPWLRLVVLLHRVSTSRQNLPMVPTSFLPCRPPPHFPPASISICKMSARVLGGRRTPPAQFPNSIIRIPGHSTAYVPSICNHLPTPPIYDSQKRNINTHTAVLCTY